MLRGIWLQTQFGEIVWVELEIDALREGGEYKYKQKGNDYTVFSLSNR